jgi:4-hydroxy-tetrahydrodipicolinate reductase
VINFTTPEATLESAKYCAHAHLPLVTGTTGFTQKQMRQLKAYAQKTAIMWSPNMSLAVNLIQALLPCFAQLLTGSDIEIVEQHHRAKEDAPSGTALFFAQALAQVTEHQIVCGRAQGQSAGRAINEICIHSVRGGSAEGGVNEVRFLAGQEEVTIRHRAFSNLVYAQGALLAVKWLLDNPTPGFYTMKDVFTNLVSQL